MAGNTRDFDTGQLRYLFDPTQNPRCPPLLGPESGDCENDTATVGAGVATTSVAPFRRALRGIPTSKNGGPPSVAGCGPWAT